MQTLPVPHGVPLGLFPAATHADTPDAQDVVPSLQGSVNGHVLPAAQAVHVPALQTLSVPHGMPFAIIPPASPQLIVGEQTFLPVWHGFDGTQLIPSMHATHAPPLQTLPAPHGVPFGALADSRHTGAPVLHTVVPVRQGLPVTAHVAPATHVAQEPAALQTMSFPQAVPAARFMLVSLHCAPPLAHASAPLWHGLVGVHASPAVQALHVPT
jgi:hypothetical protein